MGIDNLIESISFYRRRPLYAHIYVLPLAGLIFSWLYIWFVRLGYEEHYELGMVVSGILCILQALVLLFAHWFVSVRCFLMYYAEKDPQKAEYVAVSPTQNNGWPEVVPLSRSLYGQEVKIWFEFQRVIYTMDNDSKKFATVVFDSSHEIQFYKNAHGFESEEELSLAQHRYGNNKTEMVIPKFTDLFMERATAPFFVFQVFCVGLWCLEDMWYYSLFTLFMLATFEATLVKAQMKNMQEIRNMGNKKFMINVYRNKKWTKISSEELVAGDVITLGRSTDNQTVPSDVLLLRGSCIVDESMLTGESVPQMKEAIDDLENKRFFDIETDGRLHMIFGGTTIVQHTAPTKGEALKSPDSGCLCFVLRTGFNTSQGKLLRTILFGVKRVTANNIETLCFIIFLLIFAVAASGYLWIVGCEDEKRSKYKLFLECTLIITSVIPPELPIELSLAVNSSLIALQKLGVFCTEPFRIPFAGKIDYCCFDKTGTLTTDNLVVEGICMINGGDENGIISDVSMAPSEAVQVLSSCHSLGRFEDDLVGDPLEKACLDWCQWTLTKADAVVPAKGIKIPGMRIFHRFHFSSSMKRMTVIAGYQTPGSQESNLLVSVKGAPEILRSMYSILPDDYDENYKRLTRQGSRVLALGIKEMPGLRQSDIRDKSREFFEQSLTFAGFVVISCPLKPDTKSMIKEILESSHKVVMITGDNPLTACHVAKVLKFTRSKKKTLILDSPIDDGIWRWKAVDESEIIDLIPTSSYPKLFFKIYEFCLTGSAFSYLQKEHKQFLSFLLPNVRVFARMAPKQKENVINEFKRLGFNTLMCGDGTNDVGALKHASVGVALLSNPYDATKAEQREKERREKIEEARRLHKESSSPTNLLPGVVRRTEPNALRNRSVPSPQVTNAQKRLHELMKELEDEEKANVVKLGDASIAAPFTSKYTSIASICHVIKQGRCTLVTTLQMFKILALNALVSAYSLSVLYLDGVKFSDTQATIQGLLLAACFLFISRSRPLQTLSKQRPLPNIFNGYMILTVTIQFVIHFACLLFMVNEAHRAEPIGGPIDLEAKFTPNVLNTTVYIMSMALQVCTFAVNYRGRPFMESLFENKSMLYSVLFSGFAIFTLASGSSTDLMNQFELVLLPVKMRNYLLLCISVDLVGCYVVDRALNFFLGDMF